MRGADVVSGMQAGLLSGTFVAVFFFLGDLIHQVPLSTPLALMQKLSLLQIPQEGGVATLDLAAIFETTSRLSLGGGLLALTTLHLLAFAVLAVAAVGFFDWSQLPLNAATGAVWGLVVFTLAFELSMVIASVGFGMSIPSFRSVVAVNLLAGAIMGGYVRRRTKAFRRARPRPVDGTDPPDPEA